jgi:hypothetical protein
MIFVDVLKVYLKKSNQELVVQKNRPVLRFVQKAYYKQKGKRCVNLNVEIKNFLLRKWNIN